MCLCCSRLAATSGTLVEPAAGCRGGTSQRTGWTLRKRKAQRCNKIDWRSVGADRPNAPRRARVVLVSSADRPFKGDEETFDPARPDAAPDFDGGDRLELPAPGQHAR